MFRFAGKEYLEFLTQILEISFKINVKFGGKQVHIDVDSFCVDEICKSTEGEYQQIV